jgi:hypothetical protein
MLTICSIVVLIAICLVGLLKPNSLNAGILPSNPIILPAEALPGDPNAPTLTPLPPEAQASATAAALLDVQPFADLLSTAVATLLPADGTAVAGLPLAAAGRSATARPAVDGSSNSQLPGAAPPTAGAALPPTATLDPHDPDSRDRWQHPITTATQAVATTPPLPLGATPTKTPLPPPTNTPRPGTTPTRTPPPPTNTPRPGTTPTRTPPPPTDTQPTNTPRPKPTDEPPTPEPPTPEPPSPEPPTPEPPTPEPPTPEPPTPEPPTPEPPTPEPPTPEPPTPEPPTPEPPTPEPPTPEPAPGDGPTP